MYTWHYSRSYVQDMKLSLLSKDHEIRSKHFRIEQRLVFHTQTLKRSRNKAIKSFSQQVPGRLFSWKCPEEADYATLNFFFLEINNRGESCRAVRHTFEECISGKQLHIFTDIIRGASTIQKYLSEMTKENQQLNFNKRWISLSFVFSLGNLKHTSSFYNTQIEKKL